MDLHLTQEPLEHVADTCLVLPVELHAHRHRIVSADADRRSSGRRHVSDLGAHEVRERLLLARSADSAPGCGRALPWAAFR